MPSLPATANALRRLPIKPETWPKPKAPPFPLCRASLRQNARAVRPTSIAPSPLPSGSICDRPRQLLAPTQFVTTRAATSPAQPLAPA